MKKIVASLLSVIMLVFACGPVGLAYNFSDGVLTSGTTENDMPTLQAVYMNVMQMHRMIPASSRKIL